LLNLHLTAVIFGTVGFLIFWAFFSSQFLLCWSLDSSFHQHEQGSNGWEVPAGERHNQTTAKARTAATSSADDVAVCFGEV